MICVVKGKTHMEVACELGTSRQAVTDILKKSFARLRKLYGIDENCAGSGFFFPFPEFLLRRTNLCLAACHPASWLWGK